MLTENAHRKHNISAMKECTKSRKHDIIQNMVFRVECWQYLIGPKGVFDASKTLGKTIGNIPVFRLEELLK